MLKVYITKIEQLINVKGAYNKNRTAHKC